MCLLVPKQKYSHISPPLPDRHHHKSFIIHHTPPPSLTYCDILLLTPPPTPYLYDIIYARPISQKGFVIKRAAQSISYCSYSIKVASYLHTIQFFC